MSLIIREELRISIVFHLSLSMEACLTLFFERFIQLESLTKYF